MVTPDGTTVFAAILTYDAIISYKFDDGIREFIALLNKGKAPLHQDVIYLRETRDGVEVDQVLVEVRPEVFMSVPVVWEKLAMQAAAVTASREAARYGSATGVVRSIPAVSNWS